MYLSIVNVKPLEGYKLLLTFENNEERIFDVSPYLSIGRFSELKELSLFNTVRVSFDSIEWGNRLDLDPELLYLKSIKMVGQTFLSV
ncbi:DUF2442 domain-containing protein [Candidatus Desantisbacteria bacterium]|nr:DUF2442 domain-containing protein [Candidatus Desantisbacteria bacterium]